MSPFHRSPAALPWQLRAPSIPASCNWAIKLACRPRLQARGRQPALPAFCSVLAFAQLFTQSIYRNELLQQRGLRLNVGQTRELPQV